jgi:hypothetical protein
MTGQQFLKTHWQVMVAADMDGFGLNRGKTARGSRHGAGSFVQIFVEFFLCCSLIGFCGLLQSGICATAPARRGIDFDPTRRARLS